MATHSASAKEIEGVDLQAQYSANGNRLYLTEMRGRLQGHGALDWQGIGVRVVDISAGHIVAEALGNEHVVWLQSTPAALYTFSLTAPSLELAGCPWTLRRLDASGAETTAKRTFDTAPESAVTGTR